MRLQGVRASSACTRDDQKRPGASTFTRAISGPLTRVTRGQPRSLQTTRVGRSAPQPAVIALLPKLIVRVRFSSEFRQVVWPAVVRRILAPAWLVIFELGLLVSHLSRADAVSVDLTHPLLVSADLTQQVLVSLQILWPSWTASVRAGYARRRCGRVGRAAVIRQRHCWPARTPPGRPQTGRSG